MMRTILIDDEPKNISILQTMLERFCPEVLVVGCADNSATGIEIIEAESPDLVFLDIEMPYGNAFDLLDKLKPISFEVVFVTAFDSYMLKAFKYSALDYLLKPVDIAELQETVQRALSRRKSRKMDYTRLEYLVQTLKTTPQHLDRIALPAKDGFVFRDVADITRCEATRGYTVIHLLSGEKVMASRNIKDYEDLLPETVFFRIHNSHLININFVKRYHKGRGGQIEMMDGTMLEVATRRKDQLLARFGIKGI